jgi:nucleoside-diphosphate-sugar epimerase
MKMALVLGITGGFGGHVAEALAERGWQLRALMRDPARLPERFKAAEVVVGDAGCDEDVRRAADGAQLLVYGVNAPYGQWDSTVVPWLDVSARVAEAARLTIVFPGNVYNFDPADGPRFDEQAPMQPPTAKGRLRVQMESRLRRASAQGARVLIVRAGNFVGAHAPSTWLRHLIKRTARGYALSAAGPRDLKHAWAYLPDLAQTIAELIAQPDRLTAFSVFHFRGHEASFDDLAAAIQQASGHAVRMKNFPWWAMRLAAPFSAWSRSLLEMRYLWEHPVQLAETRLVATLPMPVPHTPLTEALVRSGLVARRSDAPDPAAFQV